MQDGGDVDFWRGRGSCRLQDRGRRRCGLRDLGLVLVAAAAAALLEELGDELERLVRGLLGGLASGLHSVVFVVLSISGFHEKIRSLF